MKILHSNNLILLLILLFVSACSGGESGGSGSSGNLPTSNNGRDREAEVVEKALHGNKILLSWREGEAVYGTFFFEEIHFCNQTGYLLFGQSEKNTVLDNIQRGNWRAEGRWEVRRQQGQLGVNLQPNSGQEYFVPIRLGNDGRISNPYVEISRQGRANCS